MSRTLVRRMRLVITLCLVLACGSAVAFVPLPAQRSSASSDAPSQSSITPQRTPRDRKLSYLEERGSNDANRKPAGTTTRREGTAAVPPLPVGAQPPPSPQEETEDEPEDDPDLPRSLRGRVKIDKEEYLRRRSEHIGTLRGFGEDPLHAKRAEALKQLENQIRLQRELKVSPLTSNSVWRALGPAPIPNGQTTNRTDPVSGRTISIAIHPTNPNIVYVGTAQGGLYRSLDGGASWTPLMDTAQSLAIGALALAPSNPSILYVGTGENSLSADSFFGVGLYRIENADTNATLFGPINPPVTTGIAGTTAFTGRAVSEILVHPTDPATIFVATAAGTSSNPTSFGYSTTPPLAIRGVYRSTNATSNSPSFTKLTVVNSNSIPPDTSGDRDIMDLAMEPGNPNVVLAWVGGASPFNPPPDTHTGVWRTTNALGAATFTKTFQSTVTGVRGEFAINKIGSTVNVVVATGERANETFCGQGFGIVRTSSDGGATWSNKKPGGGGFCGNQCSYDIAVEIHPNDANLILLGGSAPGACSFDFARSTDGAATDFVRTNTGLHADTHALAIAPSNPNVVYIGNDGGIWKSTDTGQTWTSLNNNGFNATQFQDMALHPLDREFMIGGTQDNGTQFKQPNGVWKRADFGDGGHSLIDQGATDTTNVTMYHTYFNQSENFIGFARITNTSCANEGQWNFRGGFRFSAQPSSYCPATPLEAGDAQNGIDPSDAVRFYAPMALGPGTPNSVYFGTDKLYRDGLTRGDSMVAVSQDLGGTTNVITSIGISRLNDNVRVIGTFDGKVFATATGSNPMTDVTDTAEFPGLVFGVRRTVSDIAIDPNNSNIAYVAFGGYEVAAGRHIFKTTNLTATLLDPSLWTPSGNGIPDVPVDTLVIDPANSNILYAGTDIGVYISTDAGANWTPFTTGLPRVAVFDLEIQAVHRVLRAVTHGRGMWEIALVGDLPGISDIPNQVTNENTPDTTPFAVGSAVGNPNALVLSATVANPSLASVSFSGTGNDRIMTITPAVNQTGTTEITVTVTEGAKTNSDSFLLTIKAGNSAPVLDNSGNLSLPAINEDISNASNIGTTVGAIIASDGGDRITDADVGASEGIAVIAVNNTNGTWQFSVNNGDTWTPFGNPSNTTARLLAAVPANRVRFVPNANFFGTISPGITFRAWDMTSGTNGDTADASAAGGSRAFSTAIETASITVNSVNDAPTLNAIGDLVINEDAPLQTINLSGITAGGGESQALVVTATSNNTSLIPNPAVTYTSPNATGTITFTPAANQSGSALITVTVSDGGGTANGGIEVVVRSFTVTVNPINDAPTLNTIGDLVINEDAPLQTVNLSGITAGGGESQTLIITATSNNTSLIPNPAITYTSPNNAGTLAFTPAMNQSGSALITVTINDGGGTANGGVETVVRSFTVTVNAVNDAPTIDAVGTLTISEDAPLQTINLTGITAGGGESQALVVTAASNNTSLIPNPALTYTSSNNAGTITFTPTANQSGSALITVTVSDDGGTANGGVETVVLTFTVTVNAVNDAPVNTVPAAQSIIANTSLTFSAAAGNPIQIADIDTGSGNMRVTLTAGNGALTLPVTGLAFINGDGTNDAAMTFTGTITSINTALNNLVFTPTSDFIGTASVQITTDDQGNTGSGGSLSDTDAVSITVAAQPVQFDSATYTVNEAAGHAAIIVTRTGGTAGPLSVQYATGDVSGLTNCNVVSGNASARCDYTAVGNTLTFAVGQSSVAFTVPIINDVYVEGAETLTLTLSNPTGGGVLASPSNATLTIIDNDSSPGAANPIDTREFFVRQLYLDFLNREPEPSGLADWLNRLNTCPRPGETLQDCDEIEVASAFFRSPESFDRSYFLYRFYEGALVRQPQYDEFQNDLRRLTGFLSAEELEQRKQQFAEEFVNRAEFRALYDSFANGQPFVDAVLTRVGAARPGVGAATVVASNRVSVINRLGSGQITRGQALRELMESPEVSQRFFNKAFVVVEYFSFLRRNPDAAYLHWINVLNTTGDYREMIRGFLQSAEYRFRFGQN
jgi:Calx-beta domain/Bacterial Ig domain